MPQQNPKKQKTRSKKLNLNSKTKWKNIVKDVDKSEVPIHVLEKLIVYLKDGTEVIIDIKEIIREGVSLEDLELHVNQRLKDLDFYIKNVDFFVDLDSVERTVQPVTDKILAKL